MSNDKPISDAAQAPVAWMLQELGQSKRWYTSGETAMQHWVSKGAIATPLYAAPVTPAAAAPSTEIPGATAALRKLLDSSNDYGSLIEFSYSPEWQAASEVLARPAEAVPTHLRGGTVINDSVVKRLAAKFCFLPPDETEQADEHEKVTRDLLIYGSGFIRDGQHIPFAEAVEQPDARDAFIRKIAAQTPEQPDYWSECGQCRHNAEDAQDLLDSAAAPQATVTDEFDAERHQVLLGYDKSGDAIFGTDPVAHARATAPKTTGPIYQIGANAGGGIAWWDVDKDRYEREKKAGYMKTGIVYREPSCS